MPIRRAIRLLERLFGVCFHEWRDVDWISNGMMGMLARTIMEKCTKCGKTRFERY
jgi:hypothetical protein